MGVDSKRTGGRFDFSWVGDEGKSAERHESERGSKGSDHDNVVMMTEIVDEVVSVERFLWVS